MKKLGLSILGCAATLAIAAPAHAAATFDYVPGAGGLGSGEVSYADFDTTTGSPSGSGFLYLSPPSSNQGAEPATGDQGDIFFSVLGGGDATFTFADPLSQVGFDYGSADDYNTFVVYLASGGTETWTGQDILNTIPAAANGDRSSMVTNGRLTFTASAGDAITGIRLLSSRNSLEIDNIGVVSAVPEPGTWAMMLLGFGAIGFTMRRRQAKGTLAQLA
ncbi:PEPxxWA-CTERM sorting domain-containing protein [Sphingomonas arenae]|uniref:Npun_F0296 family exosortase-dependent surface protein n=1 Tax=Sphingomonas arenae TaxID=2812555 RepID=UPI0019672D5B|nr:PEPxxWA-CTERM sorting domain-containing protein [Sphingomonas arenae]